MAGLSLKEDSGTGRLTLYSPLLPRLGTILFGLFWLAIIVIAFLPGFSGEQVDWGNLVFAFFALVPVASSMAALVTTTVVIDPGARTVTTTRRLLILPFATNALSFNDLAKIEIQYFHQTSSGGSVGAWRVDAVSRNGKHIPLNWSNRREEVHAIAQKVSALTRAPVSESTMRLPTVFERVLKNVVPETTGKTEQSDANIPAPSQPEITIPDSQAPPPVAAPRAMPGSLRSETATEAEPSRAADLRSLTVESLEKRIASDSLDVEARYVLARKYHARHQTDLAISLYQQAVRLDPVNPNAQNDLGVALQQRGKRAEAEVAYRRAIALDPFSSTAHLNLGLLLRSLNRATEASQEFLLARQNARGEEERRAAEAASIGARMEPRVSKTNG